MRQTATNPSNNCLPPSADEAELLQAIATSGYPLQGLVAEKLQSEFFVTEEWGYIDCDTKEHRSLDVFGYKKLVEATGSVVEPALALLVECKRSVHPFVFFQNVTDRGIHGFPEVAGLKRGVVEIHETSGKRYRESKGAYALGLDKLPFAANGPPICSVFSRATLSGKKAELSGTELFNGLVLPLVKAFDHADGLYKALSQQDHLFPVLLLSLGVVDAPMILVESPHRASDPILTPWVRVLRQETVEESHSLMRFGQRDYGIDVVHIGFLDEFLSTHLMPFAKDFGQRARQMAEVLRSGGEVQDLDHWSWDQIRKKKQ
jgi:hypothetical protein